jgi:hypothetical protein
VKERIIKGMIDLYKASKMTKEDFISLARKIIK